MSNWNLMKSITKNNIVKPISTLTVVETMLEETYLLLSNTNGTIYLTSFNGNEFKYKKLEGNKLEHDSPILSIGYSVETEIVSSISKSCIYLVSIRNPKINKRIKIFDYCKINGIKPYGIVQNLCISSKIYTHKYIYIYILKDFSVHSFILYGKSSVFSLIELNISDILNKNITQKEVKQLLITMEIDIKKYNYIKEFYDKEIKIYNIKVLKLVKKYLLLGTNKGLLVLEFNSNNLPNIELNEYYSFSRSSNYIFNAISEGVKWNELRVKGDYGYLYIINDNKNINKITHLSNCLDNKISYSFFERIKILIHPNSDLFVTNKEKISTFSNSNFIICFMDTTNFIYTIYFYQKNSNKDLDKKAIYSNNNKSNKSDDNNKNNAFVVTLKVKSGNANNFVWCKYYNIFAISKYAMNNKMFTVSLYKIDISNYSLADDIKFNVELIYNIENSVSFKLYSFHYLGIISSNKEDAKSKSDRNIKFSMHSWINKDYNSNMMLSEMPLEVLCSNNTEFLVFIFNKNYSIYKNKLIDSNNKLCSSLVHICAINLRLIHYYLFDNFVLIFITDSGIYFHVLSENYNTYPIKLLKASKEYLNLNQKLLNCLKNNENNNTTSIINSNNNSLDVKITNSINKVNNPDFKDKSLPCKILCLLGYKLILSYDNSAIKIIKIDNILIRAINYIKERNISALQKNTFSLLEKKYIKTFIAILNHYFSDSEEVYRRIFTSVYEIKHFELYRYIECFLNDFSLVDVFPYSNKISNILIKTQIIESLIKKDMDKLLRLYSVSSSNIL